MTTTKSVKNFNANLNVNLIEVQGLYPQFEEVHWRTKYYLIDRYRMFSEVSARNGYVTIECRCCGAKRKLQLHHVKGNGFNGDYTSGWHHYEMKRQVEEGEALLTLCQDCHQGWHGSTLSEDGYREKIKELSDRVLRRYELMK